MDTLGSPLELPTETLMEVEPLSAVSTGLASPPKRLLADEVPAAIEGRVKKERPEASPVSVLPAAGPPVGEDQKGGLFRYHSGRSVPLVVSAGCGCCPPRSCVLCGLVLGAFFVARLGTPAESYLPRYSLCGS